MVVRPLACPVLILCLLAGCAGGPGHGDVAPPSKDDTLVAPSYAIYKPSPWERVRDTVTDAGVSTGQTAGDAIGFVVCAILLAPIWLLGWMGIPSMAGGAK